MKKKLWFRVFVRIAAIFAAFVLVLTVANRAFLLRFFRESEKKQLLRQGKIVSELDFDDNDSVVNALSRIIEEHNFETEIYTASGKVIYTSFGSQMLDFYYKGDRGFSMQHKPLKARERSVLSDGSVYETAVDTHLGTEYLVHRRALTDGLFLEIRVQMSLLESSARTAGTFISIVAIFCLFAALIFTYFWVRRFVKPITEMSEITRDMADLSFERKVSVGTEDEIGILGHSINEMSQRLSATLADLKQKNEILTDEIEHERQLDAMRKGFVANVSHELKTPIAIIQGYAEGLKDDINPASREQYCDIIIDESQRMNRLVLGLLALSRYEAGQVPIRKERFSLSKMAEDMTRRILAGKEVSVLCPKEEVFALSDELQTEQIFKSLLENAAAHVNEGGRVEIRFIPSESEIKVEIFNTGSFVEPEKMPHIWQSFYRGEESHKRSESRFGLGLSIVSAICKAQGKTCGVYNKEDGVCFWFVVDKA